MGTEADPPSAPTSAAPSGRHLPLPGSLGRRMLRVVGEVPVLVVLALVVAVVIKTFLVQAFYIPSASMIPTLQVGDRVLVEKLTYHFRAPRPGDVVVFQAPGMTTAAPDVPWYEDAADFVRALFGLPTGSDQDYIKRVVAVGGDRIRYEGTPRRLFVNDRVVPQPYVLHGIDRNSPGLGARDCRRLHMRVAGRDCLVPSGDVFVMGDHRGNSEDSRFIGPVRDRTIVGRAFTVIWPPGHFGGL